MTVNELEHSLTQFVAELRDLETAFRLPRARRVVALYSTLPNSSFSRGITITIDLSEGGAPMDANGDSNKKVRLTDYTCHGG